MKKTILFISLSIFVCCSTLKMEPTEPMIGVEEEGGKLMTRATAGEEEPCDEASVLHYYQTDHRMILIRHVELRDSVYVQTLTEDDMANLHITPTEKEFGNDFVVQMNELFKHIIQ